MIELILKVGLSYLLGSVIGALWVGYFYGHVDIRTMGSGNAGGTNALRTQGWLFAFLVVIVDVGKGVLAAAWVPGLDLPGDAAGLGIAYEWLPVACGTAAVVGHVFPVYHGFRGGKGAATIAGSLVAISWPVLLMLLIIWLVCATLTGFVGFATMLSITGAAVFAGTTVGWATPVFAFTAVMALFTVFNHRSNISRMLSGTENRSTKLMLFKPRGRAR